MDDQSVTEGTVPNVTVKQGPTWRDVWRPTAVILAFGAMLTLGWLLAELVFRYTGRPADLPAYLVAVYLGLLVFSVGAYTAGRLRNRLHGDQRYDAAESILAALDRIAQGDFSVRLPA
ncbi:MAG: hypothetical protein LBR33_03770, partial [Propionibacteriaceae bacterium]|nr:hypothetical protein [Propionibacteriaceae bacterium]